MIGEFSNSPESLFQTVTMKKTNLLKYLHIEMLKANHPAQLKNPQELGETRMNGSLKQYELMKN